MSEQKIWYIETDDRYGMFDCEDDCCSNTGRYILFSQNDVIMMSIDSYESAMSSFGEDVGMFVCEDCFEEFRQDAILIGSNNLPDNDRQGKLF